MKDVKMLVSVRGSTMIGPEGKVFKIIRPGRAQTDIKIAKTAFLAPPEPLRLRATAPSCPPLRHCV